MDPGYQPIGTSGFLGYYSGVLGAQSVLIETLKMLKLTLKVKVEGGNRTPAEAGYATAEEAKKWYSATGVQHVQLDASAHVGFYFTHWSGDGVAYPTALSGGPAIDSPMPLDNPDEPVTIPRIWIAMGGGAGAKQAGEGNGGDREVEANVKPKAALVINGGGTVGETIAQGPLEDLGYEVTPGDQPVKDGTEGLLAAVDTHHIFVFYGHDGPDDSIRIAYDLGITYPGLLSPADVKSTKPHPPYLLVLMLACGMSEDEAEAWRDAFDADCIIGFSGQVNEGWVDNFEEKFWEEVENGNNGEGAWAAAAAGTAWIYAEPFGEVSLIVKGNVKLKKD